MTKQRLAELEALYAPGYSSSHKDVMELITEVHAAHKRENDGARDYIRVAMEKTRLRKFLLEARFDHLQWANGVNDEITDLCKRIDAVLGEDK